MLLACGPQHRRVHHQVVIKEVDRASRIRVDPADRSGNVYDEGWFVTGEPSVDRLLVAQIHLMPRCLQDSRKTV